MRQRLCVQSFHLIHKASSLISRMARMRLFYQAGGAVHSDLITIGLCLPAVRDNAAIDDADQPASRGSNRFIMRNQNDGMSLAMQCAQNAHHLRARRRIEVAGRFIRQNNRRFGCDRPAIAARCCWPPDSWAG